MPLIEELPITSTIRASHGWAYVPDLGQPIAAVQPGNRKRGRDAAGHPSAASLSAKREKRIEQRLKELEKENYKDVTIPIPKREENKKARKMTQNVRRILGYSRNFGHYLADEEAAVAAGGGGIAAITALPTAAGAPKVDGRRKSAVVASTANQSTPQPTKSTAVGKREKANANAAAPATPTTTTGKDTEMTDSPHTKTTPKSPTQMKKSPKQPPPTQAQSQPRMKYVLPVNPSLDADPLLRTRDLPKMPSDSVMQALLAEPPLSYSAARAKPLDHDAAMTSASNTTPRRYFCAICGYWGKVRCLECGERVCGLLECWKDHQEICDTGY